MQLYKVLSLVEIYVLQFNETNFKLNWKYSLKTQKQRYNSGITDVFVFYLFIYFVTTEFLGQFPNKISFFLIMTLKSRNLTFVFFLVAVKICHILSFMFNI